MSQKDSDIIDYGYVYKITFPNGKIYVGRDTAKTAEYDYYKYMGTPCLAAKRVMNDEMIAYRDANNALTLTKELMYEARNCTVSHIKQKEREFIALLDAKNKLIGYNII